MVFSWVTFGVLCYVQHWFFHTSPCRTRRVYYLRNHHRFHLKFDFFCCYKSCSVNCPSLLAIPVKPFSSIYLAAELRVSLGIFLFLYSVCCPCGYHKCCQGENSFALDWKTQRKYIVAARFGAGLWASMIAIIVMGGAGVSPLHGLPIPGNFLFDVDVVGYALLISAVRVMCEFVLEFLGFIMRRQCCC